MGQHGDRLKRNDESRSKAGHHGEPWSQDELDQLFGFWDGTDETLAEIAELLGRTIEACRQRFYESRRGHVRVVTKTTTVVKGWLVGYCFQCGKFSDVYSDGIVSLCDDCRN